MKTVKAEIKRERQVNTFNDLSNANSHMLEVARKQDSGCFYDYMSCLIFAAFTFEAYLNHVGHSLFTFWKDIESISTESKLNVICTQLNIKPDFSRRPYQTLKKVLKFRNAIAHGKSEFIFQEKQVVKGEIEEIRRNHPLTKWEELCTLKNAEESYEDIRAIMKEIHPKAGLGDNPVSDSGYAGYEMRIVEEFAKES